MDVDVLKGFVLERILNEDPASQSISLLGTLPHPSVSFPSTAILRIERLPLPGAIFDSVKNIIDDADLIDSTDIYSWFLAWTKKTKECPDIKINIVCPATEVHIRKYSKQQIRMVRETPEIYDKVVKPYISAFPPSRTQWVENILSGVSEVEKVLVRDDFPAHGFVVLPDMKWDLINLSNLYLVAIALDRTIHSLRDLKKTHLPMLQKIRTEACRIVKDRWGLGNDQLRFYVHYQPSYYHFHVHIVNANYTGLLGMSVGQAHLLEDIISLLELSSDTEPTIIEKMTWTYGLGEQHGLYASMKEYGAIP